MNYRRAFVTSAVSAALALVLSGCASAPPAPVQFESTEQGFATTVSANLERTADWTARAFRDLGIRLQEMDADADAREYVGMYKQMRVRAALKRSASGTKIEVIARENGSALEKVYAQKVIERIVRHGR